MTDRLEGGTGHRYAFGDTPLGELSLLLELDDLDELRHSDPHRAAHGVERILSAETCANVRCYALGVAASAYRTLGIRDRAKSYLAQAAETQPDESSLLADLLIRGAYLTFDCGEHRQSLLMATVALQKVCKYGRRRQIGRVLVDYGTLHTACGDHSVARESCESALMLLSNIQDRRHRLAAYLNLGEIHFQAGKLDKASSNFSRAAKLTTRSESVNHAKVLWRQGEISVHRGAISEGIRLIGAAVDGLRDPRERAAAKIDLSEAHLKNRDPKTAAAVAKRALFTLAGDPSPEAEALREKLQRVADPVEDPPPESG